MLVNFLIGNKRRLKLSASKKGKLRGMRLFLFQRTLFLRLKNQNPSANIFHFDSSIFWIREIFWNPFWWVVTFEERTMPLKKRKKEKERKEERNDEIYVEGWGFHERVVVVVVVGTKCIQKSRTRGREGRESWREGAVVHRTPVALVPGRKSDLMSPFVLRLSGGDSSSPFVRPQDMASHISDTPYHLHPFHARPFIPKTR